MKIYNEITSIFNEQTGQWETISEDSFDYNGPMALMAEGGTSLPSNASEILDDDIIIDTVKTTTGYFTNGDGTLEGNIIHTASLADDNEDYYFNVCQTHPASSSAETQFSVAYGHIFGSGSNAVGDTTSPDTLKTSTEAVYKQFASILLPEGESTASFFISSQGSSGVHSTGTRDDYVYFLVGKRARQKDRMNKKTWTLSLSGSLSYNQDESPLLKLTDDSATQGSTATPAGPRYNIISGTLGNASLASGATSAAVRTFGWFYPDQGIMVFSGVELSASIPGITNIDAITSSFSSTYTPVGTGATLQSQSGFAPNLDNTGNSANALKLVNCMRNMGSSVALRLRGEEDLTQENYFCRIKAAQYNFSNNPTFTSGSENYIRHSTMRGNPTTFISGVGLYNAAGALLATAKLSSPLKKNFVSEATIKVKLTY